MLLLKKFIKPLFKIIVLALALFGAYYCYLQCQYHSVKVEVEKREASRAESQTLKITLVLSLTQRAIRPPGMEPQ